MTLLRKEWQSIFWEEIFFFAQMLLQLALLPLLGHKEAIGTLQNWGLVRIWIFECPQIPAFIWFNLIPREHIQFLKTFASKLYSTVKPNYSGKKIEDAGELGNKHDWYEIYLKPKISATVGLKCSNLAGDNTTPRPAVKILLICQQNLLILIHINHFLALNMHYYIFNFLAWIIWIYCWIEFWCEYFEELNLFWIKMTGNRCSNHWYNHRTVLGATSFIWWA